MKVIVILQKVKGKIIQQYYPPKGFYCYWLNISGKFDNRDNTLLGYDGTKRE
jgi:hypothetical protein